MLANARGLLEPGSMPEIALHPTVDISPLNVVTRRSLAGHGITAEFVDYMGADTVLYRFRGSQHLLVASWAATSCSGMGVPTSATMTTRPATSGGPAPAAPARHGLNRNQAGDLRLVGCVCRHPSLRRGGGACGARRCGDRATASRAAIDRLHRFSPSAWRNTRARQHTRSGRLRSSPSRCPQAPLGVPRIISRSARRLAPD